METKQVSDPNMTRMLEHKAPVVNMLKALMDKVESMQKQMGTVGRDGEVIRKDKKEMVEIKKICNRNKECL